MSRLRFDAERRGGRILAVLVTAFVALWAMTASATVMLYQDLAGLVELSDVIVQGRVVDQDTFYDDKAHEVATITTVEVDKTFLGDVDKTVKFRQWGGNMDGKMSKIPGDAQFDPYEEVVLFLVDGHGKFAGMRYLVALGQSKYSVVRNGDNVRVVRDLRDMAFLDQESKEIETKPVESYSLDSFVPELQALIAGIKGGQR